MAVYKRIYKPYEGLETPEWSRFLVLPKYSLSDLMQSRMLLTFYISCLLPILIEALMIYIINSPSARALLQMRGQLMAIDAQFFHTILGIQAGLAFVLASWIGPVLISPDLSNNALPLYLCRPFSRAEYVLGKASVLIALLSLITWIPVLFLFFLQAGVAEAGWFWPHGYIGRAIVLGSFIWIAVLVLLSLAISAWVRWRIVASALLFGIFFISSGFGEAINNVLRTYWGKILNIQYLNSVVWHDLFGLPLLRSGYRRGFRGYSQLDLPSWVAWVALISICLFCLYLLNRRLQAREVIR